jgi:hypothetical protein
VAAIAADIAKDPERVTGYRIVSAPPMLRPFKVRLEPELATVVRRSGPFRRTTRQ